ncbi:hypothetical protein Y1Q_0004825 [Alligator mississippiensis]|uniref:Uncharacterized protein n=1 Tax=Alligator mississippiensis TaxID=8496 RepID=A0A151NQY0_ALLMI|nr:hypothetical protein Y1Q_0004825 [Alligator mississippiensis]
MSQKAKASSVEPMAQEANTSNAHGPNWSQEELEDIIDIWSEQMIIDRLESRRNKPVYVKIAKGMQKGLQVSSGLACYEVLPLGLLHIQATVKEST